MCQSFFYSISKEKYMKISLIRSSIGFLTSILLYSISAREQLNAVSGSDALIAVLFIGLFFALLTFLISWHDIVEQERKDERRECRNCKNIID